MKTLFDYEESKTRRDTGMLSAAQGRMKALTKARAIAVELTKIRIGVTADHVREEYEYRGGDWSELGNAAGSIFKGKNWHCIGFENSSVASSHARALRVWMLNGI